MQSSFADRNPRLIKSNFIRTPEFVVDYMCREAMKGLPLHKTVRILEPAAGDGAILRGIERHIAPHIGTEVMTYELDPIMAGSIKTMFHFDGNGHQIAVCGDFLRAEFDGQAPFDLILMNPPFSETDKLPGAGYSWLFIRKALEVLETGGVLISVLPNHMLANSYKSREEILNSRVFRVNPIPCNAWQDQGHKRIHSSLVWFSGTPGRRPNLEWIPHQGKKPAIGQKELSFQDEDQR